MNGQKGTKGFSQPNILQKRIYKKTMLILNVTLLFSMSKQQQLIHHELLKTCMTPHGWLLWQEPLIRQNLQLRLLIKLRLRRLNQQFKIPAPSSQTHAKHQRIERHESIPWSDLSSKAQGFLLFLEVFHKWVSITFYQMNRL